MLHEESSENIMHRQPESELQNLKSANAQKLDSNDPSTSLSPLLCQLTLLDKQRSSSPAGHLVTRSVSLACLAEQQHRAYLTKICQPWWIQWNLRWRILLHKWLVGHGHAYWTDKFRDAMQTKKLKIEQDMPLKYQAFEAIPSKVPLAHMCLESAVDRSSEAEFCIPELDDYDSLFRSGFICDVDGVLTEEEIDEAITTGPILGSWALEASKDVSLNNYFHL
ncbi:unnamed protein product [Protopolystoma xenopodis]|uniref:Uncharacterized protein n=1 Tax=Protopolystoma xenopodis TaxID=117903 RepID=A0A3S5CJF7_9PLAT|nr:unnamed protein product [Protopolystoma xenopodis]